MLVNYILSLIFTRSLLFKYIDPYFDLLLIITHNLLDF